MSYSVLFVAACCITYGLQFRLGLKRNIPALPLALAMSLSVLLFMACMKLPFLSLDVSAEQIASSRYMMTGALGAFLALILSRYVLKVGLQRLDDAALVFPFSIAVIKVGCFFAGCCFGIPGGGVLGVSYEMDVPAYAYQVMSGHTPVYGHTVHLHPVQLYEAAGSAVILAIMWFMRRRWKQPGSSFFFLLTLYLPLRICAEFFRASDLPVRYGLTSVQIAAFFLMLISLMLLRRNEKRSFFNNPSAVTSPIVLVSFFICELGLFLVLRNYLHFIEKVVIILAFIGVIILMIIESRNWRLVPVYRALTLPLAIGVILFSTAQVSKNDSVKKQQDTIAYKSVRIGFASGNYTNTYRDTDGCDAITRQYAQKYFMIGAGFASHKEVGTKSWEFGVSAFGGNQREIPLPVVNGAITKGEETRFSVFGAHGYAKIDWKWGGLGAGLNVGNLRYAEDRTQSPLGDRGYFIPPVFPSLYGRVGPRRWLFAQYELADAFPASTPGYLHQLSIGSGFGIKNGFTIRLGTPVTHCCTFLNVTIPTKRFAVDANYSWGDTYWDADAQANQKTGQLRFSIRYNLNRN
jgi:hypothetical protein